MTELTAARARLDLPRRTRLLSRGTATLIALLLTAAELFNIYGQVVWASGDTNLHMAYVAALGALGVATRKDAKTADTPPKLESVPPAAPGRRRRAR